MCFHIKQYAGAGLLTRGTIMKKNNAAMLFIASYLIVALVGMPGCSQENSAFVTIHLKGTVEEAFRYQKMNSSIFVKLMAWFSPEAYAGAMEHVYAYDSIKLTVEGPDLNTIEVSIPITSLTYTVEVPAGKGRTFTAIAYNGTVKNSGAFETLTLQSGEQATLQLNMLPIVQNFSASGFEGSFYINWQAILNVSGYKIYRATSADGPYDMISQIEDNTYDYYYDDMTVTETMYYYRMKIYSGTKDGVPCDYVSAIRY